MGSALNLRTLRTWRIVRLEIVPSEKIRRFLRIDRPPPQRLVQRLFARENDLVLHFAFDEADRRSIYRYATDRVPIDDLGNHHLNGMFIVYLLNDRIALNVFGATFGGNSVDE